MYRTRAVQFVVLNDLIVHAVDHKPKSSTNLRRLRNIAANPHVSALVDDYAEDWTQLWWARADGDAEIWPASENDVLDALAAKYPQYARPGRPPIVAIRVTRGPAGARVDRALPRHASHYDSFQDGTAAPGWPAAQSSAELARNGLLR